jgi:hypothetical protein
LTDRPNISQQSLYLPFRPNQPIDYETIQWQTDSSVLKRFIVHPPSPNQVLQPRNEQTNDNNTNTVVILDDNDDKNYVEAVGDEENEVPKVTTKKKGKKKKQHVNTVETNSDASVQLNTSSNRVSSAGHKYPVNIL